jgi:caffeoylshikimate esterase
VIPPWPVQQVLIFMARLLPKEKLVPQKDLAELAFKEKKKQEQVICLPHWHLKLIFSI